MKRTGMAARMDRIGLKKRKKSSVGRVPKLVEGGDLSLFSLSVKFFFSLLWQLNIFETVIVRNDTNGIYSPLVSRGSFPLHVLTCQYTQSQKSQNYFRELP